MESNNRRRRVQRQKKWEIMKSAYVSRNVISLKCICLVCLLHVARCKSIATSDWFLPMDFNLFIVILSFSALSNHSIASIRSSVCLSLDLRHNESASRGFGAPKAQNRLHTMECEKGIYKNICVCVLCMQTIGKIGKFFSLWNVWKLVLLIWCSEHRMA